MNYWNWAELEEVTFLQDKQNSWKEGIKTLKLAFISVSQESLIQLFGAAAPKRSWPPSISLSSKHFPFNSLDWIQGVFAIFSGKNKKKSEHWYAGVKLWAYKWCDKPIQLPPFRNLANYIVEVTEMSYLWGGEKPELAQPILPVYLLQWHLRFWQCIPKEYAPRYPLSFYSSCWTKYLIIWNDM